MQKITAVMDEFPEFALLRNLYHTVEHMYSKADRKSAEEIWDQWMLYLPPEKAKDYKDWCETYLVSEECFI